MKRLTVVVAASEAAARDPVKQILAARNYRVIDAPLGAALVELATSAAPCVMLMVPASEADLEVYRGFRGDPAAKQAKVIMRGGGDPMRAAVEEARDIYLATPIEHETLLSAIERAARHLLTILVADDEPLIRRMFTMFLAGQGYKVVAAEDGADAVRKVAEIVPDLVITDIKMPHLDGYELCRAIKEARNTQHIPVIMVSALGGELEIDRGFNAGANEYVTKPVQLNELGQRIQEVFRGIALRGRERVLVAIGSQIERSILQYGLTRQGFEVEVVGTATEAIAAAERQAPSAIIADYALTGNDGADIFALRAPQAGRGQPPPLVVLLDRVADKESRLDQQKRERLQAAAFISKPYSTERLVATIERILGERRLKIELERQALIEVIESIVTMLEMRDPYTRGHSENVARYSAMIGRHVLDSAEEIERLKLSARLHDIGKVAVPDAILLKPGKLTEDEMAKMKTHPMEGVKLLTRIPSLQDIVPGVRWHHERLDGRGYPDALSAPEIPLQARIISVGDTFDALTSHRPYRRDCSAAQAIEVLRAASGDQLDPELVEIFVREITALRPATASVSG